MLSLTSNIVVLVVSISVSMLCMALLNRIWPCERRHHGDDLIGWQLSVLGTTYAVILGFMLYTVWMGFGAANLNADLEASALRNVYRLAAGLPKSQSNELQAETIAYARAVIKDDWPAMQAGHLPEESHEINESMWGTLMAVKSASVSENTAEDHALSELSALTTYRRTRLIQSTSHLPVIFWCVLFAGGILTLISVLMFGSSNARFHALQVFSITLLITLSMLAIADVNQPFRGCVHVSNYPFVRAQENMSTR